MTVFVYVLKSLKDNTRYIGTSKNMERRLEEHNSGKCRYTSGRKPWKLIYNEEYCSRSKAMKREKFLKSGKGREFLDSNYIR